LAWTDVEVTIGLGGERVTIVLGSVFPRQLGDKVANEIAGRRVQAALESVCFDGQKNGGISSGGVR